MKDSEVLAGAEKLLADPKNWVKGAYRRLGDSGGESWCMVGAVNQVLNDARGFVRAPALGIHPGDKPQLDRIKARLARTVNDQFPDRPVPPGRPQVFNDNIDTTHRDVMTVVQKARIGAEEAGE